MRSKYYFFSLIFISLLFFVSCKETAKEKREKASATTEEPQKTAISTLTPLPDHVFKHIYAQSDYMDVIFEELPFSMSQEDNNNVRQLLNHVDNQAPKSIHPDCKVMGHQIYMKEGEVLIEADFYVSGTCTYFVFDYQNKKYYNNMMPVGVKFYTNLRTGNFKK